MSQNYVKLSKRLNQIGIALSAEKDILKLLEMILSESRKFTNCDAGTFYRLSKNKKFLNFEVLHNDTFKSYQGGTSGEKAALPPVPLYDENNEKNLSNVSAYVAHTRNVINIPDVYVDTSVFAEGPKNYEKFSGYRTNSMLVVPMINHKGDVIGVLQLLNAQNTKGDIIPFEDDFNDIIHSMGSQAAVALDTVELIDEVELLLNSLIKYTVKAIDERSPHTAGHSSRVAKFTKKIAELVNEQDKGPFKDINFTEDQLQEVWVAGLMHDVGKIGVPEDVLEKQNRLDGANFQVVLDRFDKIKENITFKSMLRNIKDNKPQDFENEEYLQQINQLNEQVEFIEWLNKPGYLPPEKKEFLDKIYEMKYVDANGDEHPYLSENEFNCFSVVKGNLTDAERKKIQGHIHGTKKLLTKLPFPEKWKNVPFYASSHHEWVNGKGYPNGLKGDEIPLPARIMCIADVWDALTAQDRPYKPPTPIDKACDILEQGAKFGEFDKDVVQLFLKEKPWEKKKKNAK